MSELFTNAAVERALSVARETTAEESASSAPAPDATTDETDVLETETEETLESSTVEETEDTEEEEAGEEEPVDEVEEEEETDETGDTEEEEGDEPDATETLAAFADLPEIDHEAIAKDPVLRAKALHVDRVLTRRLQELAEVRKEADTAQRRMNSVLNDLETPDGAERFLIRLSQQFPEQFRNAVEKAEVMFDDEQAQRLFQLEEEKRGREREETLSREAYQAEQVAQRTNELRSQINLAARKFGLTNPEQVAAAEKAVAAQIWANRYAGRDEGNIISRDEVFKVVGDQAQVIQGAVKTATAKAKKEAQREQAAQKRESVKRVAESNKRPPAPTASKPPRAAPPAKAQETGKPRDLDEIITDDRILSLLDSLK